MKTLFICIVTILAIASISESSKFKKTESNKNFIHSQLKRHQIKAPVPCKDAKAPVENWLEQKLDHFHPTDSRTWQQKYYSNSQWYVDGGPVFIMMGEGIDSASWLQGGQMVEQAQLYGAVVFFMEHRFFGESRPTVDVSVESMEYLSTEQALADLSFLIRYLRESAYPTGKLVVFGGSYSGNLAAWAKLRYPHLIDGAVASSAPVLAQVDFPEYQEVVARVMADSYANCVSDVKAATDAIAAILEQVDGSATITDMFNLCTPFDASNKQDVARFFSAFADLFANVVQHADTLLDVRAMCIEVVDTFYGDTPLERYVTLAKTHLAPQGGCFDHTYASIINFLNATSWESDDSYYGIRQWYYQTCTEYGYFQTSTASSQPFGDFFKVDFFLQWCPDLFSPNFNETFVYNAIDNTNLLYGGKNPQVENVVFVHGSIDPWSVQGVLEDLSESVHVVMIEGSSHCSDMASSEFFDSDELTAARLEISEWIGKWVVA